MKTTRALGVVGLAGLLGVLGCGDATEARDGGETAREPEAREAAATPAAPTALVLEEAQRKLDRGEDLAGVVDALRAVIDDETTSADDRDAAKIALSRALAAKGDKDGAVEMLEELLRSHGNSGPFAQRDLAMKRLRLLLTGSEDEVTFHAPAKNVEPGARALAKLFEPDAEGNYLIDVWVFGATARNQGVPWQLAEAKRDELETSLTPKISVGQSISSAQSWTSLPMAMGEAPADMPQADRSMLVFYYDLGSGRVPSRYDAYLPIPSDEIAAALEEGDGLIALRERPHAKPTLVIAAPRAAQLAEVEDALSKMTEAPREPVRVHLAKGLSAAEIQSVVRGSRKELRGCYEALLERDPKAEGRVDVSFQIDEKGGTRDVGLAETSTLHERAFDECIVGVAKKLEFAATGETTRVTYPFAMHP
jgi:hypothetical protein